MPDLQLNSEWLRHLPNRLTLARIAVIPLILVLHPLGFKATNVIAALIFALGAATDWLDGWLARRYQNITPLGALLDPIADKMLYAAAMVVVVRSGAAPTLLVGLLICRDLGVNGLRLVAQDEGLTIKVSEFGKWKTAVLGVALFCLMINGPMFGLELRPIGMITLWVALGLSLYSAWVYGREYLNQSQLRPKT